ncbi:MAG: hypothetical protein K2N67_06260, partial [Mucispirillum sp.]|nr:hypothetical protein [Mucispirillum sp.]
LPPFSSETKFSSISEEFKSVISEKDDFREIIPEFFFESEIFQGVELPPWAKTPHEFVYLNRKALESDYVSSTIHEWIDLIWGCNSRDRSASKKENTFMNILYDQVWKDHLRSKEEEDKIISTMEEKGIIPKQLFQTEHPTREINSNKNLNNESIKINAK